MSTDLPATPTLSALGAVFGDHSSPSSDRLQAMRTFDQARADETAKKNQQHEGFVPLEPDDVSGLGISANEVEALILKFMLNNGPASGCEIAEQTRLPVKIVRDLMQRLKEEMLVGHKGSAGMGDFVFQLSDTGQERARRYWEQCTYYGAAPVSLEAYIDSVAQQTLSAARPKMIDLCRAFSDLTLRPDMLSSLAQAINSGRGLFLFGKPGNGKTSMAERVTHAFGQHLWIPRTISVTGEMIRLFDPSCHELLPENETQALDNEARIDRRWVRIRRPTIVVGGELRMENLDISYNPLTGINEAPVHLKSNCGTLVVDDFGRQRMSTDELLNRWIVPLEKRHDYLNLPSGRQIRVPFEQLLVLSTNLEPRDLVDEAFLRRIPYKIEVHDPTDDEFRELFKRLCPKLGFAYQEAPINHLIATHFRETQRPMRFCHPRDLLVQIKNLCESHDWPLELSAEHFEVAVRNYFAVM
jgi:predicted ATPase with chaperone activity